MKIKFIKNPVSVGYGYVIGDVADLSDSIADELIKDGYAEPVKVKKSASGGAKKARSSK